MRLYSIMTITGDIEALKQIREMLNMKHIIDWDTTPEGWDYWNHVDDNLAGIIELIKEQEKYGTCKHCNADIFYCDMSKRWEHSGHEPECPTLQAEPEVK